MSLITVRHSFAMNSGQWSRKRLLVIGCFLEVRLRFPGRRSGFVRSRPAPANSRHAKSLIGRQKRTSIPVAAYDARASVQFMPAQTID